MLRLARVRYINLLHNDFFMIKKGFLGKRAQGEQFNWIFIIIAGSIILAFFAVFTTKYIQLRELQQNVEIGRNFGESLRLLQNSPIVGMERGVSIDDNDRLEEGAFKIGVMAEMWYYCRDEEAKIVFNKEERYPQVLEREILFAPSKMKMNSLDLWILPYYYPFFITNLIFLSDPRAEYFFVYDAASKNFVDELYIPGNLKSEKVDIGKLDKKADGGDLGKFIFFTSKETAEKKISALSKRYDSIDVKQVKIEDEGDGIGSVIFFDEDGKTSKPVKFFGLPLMWGAVFSGDLETFNCAANKTLKRISAISDIYGTKASLLRKTESQECSQFYSSVNGLVSNYGGKDFTIKGYLQRASIELQNNELAGKGCQYVY